MSEKGDRDKLYLLIKQNFHSVLRQVWLASGVSIKELSKQTGFSIRKLNDILTRDDADPTIQEIATICFHCGTAPVLTFDKKLIDPTLQLVDTPFYDWIKRTENPS